MIKPSGILTFTTNGVPHIEIERKFNEMLEKQRKLAFSLGKQSVNNWKNKNDNNS